MNQIRLSIMSFLLLLSMLMSAQDLCTPVGWVTQNGGVTGGGNATPVVVSNYNDLKDAVTDEDVKVIHINGTITFPSNGRISFQDQSDKTLFGLPGAKLVSTDLSSSGSGIFNAKRLDNVIFQNITFEGPGAYDVDGNDNMTIDDSRNIWVDHCVFQDGTDGNLDIKNESDFITVSWCIFAYYKAPIPDGPGGADDHRYSNLFGSSDGATGDRGKLRITMQYNWWGEGVRERMPRVRYGKVHMVNNLFNSDVSNHCIRAGYEADLRVENNYFDDQRKPIDEFDGDYTAIYASGNIGQNDMNKGSAFSPPYSLTIIPANQVESVVINGAGAKLSGPNDCNVGGVTDCNGVENGSAYLDDCGICVGGNTGRNECVVDCNGDQNGFASIDDCGVCSGGNTGIQACNGSLQAEDYCEIDGDFENTNSGFVGSGYANTSNANGSYVTYRINSQSQQNTSFGFRYANGGTSARGMQVLVNGNEQGTLNFQPTGGWTTWTAENINLNLQSGTNTIQLISTTDDGGPNIDLISFSNSLISAASCDGTPDCNGVIGGSAYLDDCDECVGGNTGQEACSNEPVFDCAGVENGSAYLDNCGECVGGNTGNVACTPSCNDVGVQYGLIGYASVNGGTTGGAGGDEVTVNTGQALQDAINDATGPRTIYVNGTINPDNSGSLSKIDIKDVSDISIIGVGTSGELDGIGLKVWRANNIIIQNLKIHHVLTGDKDGLNIEGPSDHIWVDHCEFYNQYQGVDKDYYDALLDLKRDVDNVTISWNYFHDSWKASLSGSSESDTYDRTVTYHHNRYENINSRLPLFRSGYGHVFNNHYKDIESTTINSRINACVKIENNYFQNANNPYVSAYSDVVGYGDISGNILENSPFDYASDVQELEACTASIPYDYAGYLNCAEIVPSIVEAYSGVGKLDISINDLPSVTITSPANNTIYNETATITIEANAQDSDGSITKVDFYNGASLLGSDNNAPYSFTWTDVAEGTYTISAIATDDQGGEGSSTSITVIVEAPTNTDCNGDENGSAYLDACGVCVEGNTGFEPCVGLIEAEDACSVDGIQSENSNSGFSGNGYVNTENMTGAAVSWVVSSTSSQTATFTFRYANGGTINRDGDLYVNGSRVDVVSMPVTGDWATWSTFTLSVNLNAGNNTISIDANTDEGLANLDLIYFSEGITDAECVQVGVNNTIKEEITLAPNPTTGIAQLNVSANYSVFNTLGQEVINGTGSTIDLSNLPNGIYFVKVDNKIIQVIKQ